MEVFREIVCMRFTTKSLRHKGLVSLCLGGPIVASIPPNGRFVEIDVDLFRFEKFVDAVQAELAALAALFVAAPRGLDVAGLHRVDPDDAGAEGFDHPQALEDVARPD